APNEVKSGDDISDILAHILQRLVLKYPAGAGIRLDAGLLLPTCIVLLKELANACNLSVLLILDDLDKVHDRDMRRDIFLDRAPALLSLPCALIANLPLEALFSTDGVQIDNMWSDPYILDPLPVPQSPDDAAFIPYAHIIKAARATSFIKPPQ